MMLRYKKFNNQLEFCQNYRGVPSDKWQITGFNHLNQWFNNYVGVKPGYGLAPYLGYPNNIDNYLAVAWWLDIKMRYTKCAVYSMAELKRILKGITPEEFFEN